MNKFYKLSFAAVLILSVGVAQAKTCVWKGGTLGTKNYQYWSESNNWVNAAVPVSGDTVCITNGDDELSNVVYNDISKLELKSLDYSVTKSSDKFNFNGMELTIVDEAQFSISGACQMHCYVPIATKTASTKLKYVLTSGTWLIRDTGPISGEGTVTKTGNGTLYFNYDGDKFNGTIEIKEGQAISQGAQYSNPFGSTNCVVKAYGAACPDGENTSANLTFYNPNVEVVCKIESYDSATITTYGPVTFRNQVIVHKYRSTKGSTAKFSAYYDAKRTGSTMPGYIFRGNLYIEDGAMFGFYNSCSDKFKVEFLGESVYYGTLTSLLMNNQSGSTGGNIYLGSPITTSSSAFDLDITSNQKYYFLKPNVLPSFTKLDVGSNNNNTTNAEVDFCGNDQVAGTLAFNDNKGALTNDTIFTSSTGPATLSFVTTGSASYRKLPYINGQLSVEMHTAVSQSSSNPYRACGGDTTGWLMSDWPIDLTGAEFPNLGGIDMRQTDVTGAASTAAPYVKIMTNTVLNPNIQLDLHNLGTGRLFVQTGKSLPVGSVILDYAEVAAGTYCRIKTDTAKEASDWLGKTGTKSDWNGTVTIAEHNPIAIWTGAAGDGLMTTADNWGTLATPDFTNANLTLDLRRAGNVTIVRPRKVAATITNGPYIFASNPSVKRENGIIISFR